MPPHLEPAAVLRLILSAETPGQMAAAAATFRAAYGPRKGRRWRHAFDARKGEQLVRELVPPRSEAELLQRCVKHARPGFEGDDAYSYGVILTELAARACRDYPTLRATLEDMLRRGPGNMQSLAGSILCEMGSVAWDSWPVVREAVDGEFMRWGNHGPLLQFVVGCVRAEPGRLAEVDAALWNSPTDGSSWLHVLTELGELAAPTASHVALIARDPGSSSHVRVRALRALGAMRHLPPDAVDAVLAGIDDDSTSIRLAATGVAERLQLEPARFLPRLLAHVGDGTDDESYADLGADAILAIVAYGPAARACLPQLEAHLAELEASDDTSQYHASRRRALDDAIRTIRGQRS